MKILKFFAVATFLCALSAHSQITKGNWLVGGDGYFGYSKSKNKDSAKSLGSTGTYIRPDFGYFLYDKLATGAQFSLNYSKVDQGESARGYSINPFVRYYFLDTEKTVNLLLQTSAGFANSKSGSMRSFKGRSFNVQAGPVFFFNESVALEVTANYSVSNDDSRTYHNNAFIAIGFQIHLEKE